MGIERCGERTGTAVFGQHFKTVSTLRFSGREERAAFGVHGPGNGSEDLRHSGYWTERVGQRLSVTVLGNSLQTETAIRLSPNSPQIRLAIVQLQIETNRPELDQAALDNLTQVLRYEPDNAFAWRLSAVAYGRLGNTGMFALSQAESALRRGRFTEAQQQAARAQGILAEYSAPWLQAQDVENLAKRLKAKRKN